MEELSTGTRPCSITAPVQAFPTPPGAQFDGNSAHAGSASTPHRLAPSPLSARRGSASQAGLQGQAPRATSHPTAGNGRRLLHFTGPKISRKYLLPFVILGKEGVLREMTVLQM